MEISSFTITSRRKLITDLALLGDRNILHNIDNTVFSIFQYCQEHSDSIYRGNPIEYKLMIKVGLIHLAEFLYFGKEDFNFDG